MRYVAFIVPLLALLALACEGEQEAPSTSTPMSTPAAETSEPTPMPTTAPVAQRIAYIGSDLDVWVMNADGSGQQKLFDIPIEPGDSVHNLQWSPDGAKFAVTKSPKDVVYIVSADGGKLLEIPAVAFLAWSPSGDTFAVARPAALEVEPAILLFDLKGNTVVVLPNVFSGQAVQVDFVQPSFSSDGRWLAFFKDVPGEPGGLCGLVRGVLADLETSEVRPIDPNEGDIECAAPPIFSPREPSLLAYGNRLFDLGTGQESPLPGIAARWSPDGRLLVLACGPGEGAGVPGQVYNIETTTSVLQFNLNVPFDTDQACESIVEGRSAWSPDSSLLVTVDYFRDKPSVLHIRDIATGEDRTLSIPAIAPLAQSLVPPLPLAQFSPDGRHLLLKYHREDLTSIWLVNSDGSNPIRLAEGSEPAWRPLP